MVNLFERKYLIIAAISALLIAAIDPHEKVPVIAYALGLFISFYAGLIYGAMASLGFLVFFQAGYRESPPQFSYVAVFLTLIMCTPSAGAFMISVIEASNAAFLFFAGSMYVMISSLKAIFSRMENR